MKRTLSVLLSYVLVAAVATALTLHLVSSGVWGGTSKLDQLETLILDRFAGDADATAMEDAAAAAMIKATGDRWSYYIPASEYQSYVEQSENAYVGVGITIQATENNEGFLLVEVNPEGPAAEAGLEVGDVLIAVEEEDVRGMATAGVRELVRGKEGTFVKMTVLRKGEHRSFSVERRQVLTPVAYQEMLEDGIGLVTIVNFDERCAEETISAIKTLLKNGAEKLIFDVRYNGGGYASEMVDVLDYLLPEGELFRMVSSAGKESIDYSDAEYLDIPMAVLVNGGTYSAAEFFAEALRQYDAAVIVGEQTSGKGFYQNTFRLQDGSAVALSVGRYYTPAGTSLEGVGVTPDRIVELGEEQASGLYYGTLASGDDPQIQEAVKLLKARK